MINSNTTSNSCSEANFSTCYPSYSYGITLTNRNEYSSAQVITDEQKKQFRTDLQENDKKRAAVYRFQKIAYQAIKCRIFYRGGKNLSSHQISQQQKVKNPNFWEATQKIVDHIYTTPTRLRNVQLMHSTDSEGTFLLDGEIVEKFKDDKKNFPKGVLGGSALISVSSDKNISKKFSERISILRIPAGRSLQNHHNRREKEWFVAGSIANEWVAMQRERNMHNYHILPKEKPE